jgi:hypothetical protein
MSIRSNFERRIRRRRYTGTGYGLFLIIIFSIATLITAASLR